MLKLVSLVSLLLYLACTTSQPTPDPNQAVPAYTAWVVGDTADMKVQPLGGVVLAGGSTDVDAAMRWFLRRSGGGDVLILRASGSGGYNNYLYKEVGETVNSVETILLNTRDLAQNTDILRKIRNAEAIFFAGGDQANYVNFWQGTPVANALNERIRQGVVLGGTSAGCAILSQLYFAAREGSVTSDEALANPYDKRVDLGRNDFLTQPLLANTITDQHYAARNRQGRHLAFLARAVADWKLRPRGIGVDEKTAVCATPDGAVTVFGQGNAYFLQSTGAKPERCQTNQSLTWKGDGKAVRVTILAGSVVGATGFNLLTFKSVAPDAKTEYWYAENGVKK